MKLKLLQYLNSVIDWWNFDDYSVLNKKGKIHFTIMYGLFLTAIATLILLNS